MDMTVILFIGGLIALCVGETVVDYTQRCDCFVDHPQQMFCEADYAFVGTVVSSKDLTDFFKYYVSISGDRIYEGRDYFEKGETIVPVYTPYGPSLCGRPNLEIGKEYLITGGYLEKKLVMTLCNWVEAWEDVTVQQKSFLKDKNYLDHCHSCEIIGVKNALQGNRNNKEVDDPDQISGLWRKSDCFFNPVASHIYKDVDCETAYSNCYPDKDTPGQCKWNETGEYERCFKDRESAWVNKNLPQPAAAFTKFNYVKDCKKLATKRMKKKCLKMVKDHIKNRKEDLEPRALLEELLDLRDLWLEDGDDDEDLLFD